MANYMRYSSTMVFPGSLASFGRKGNAGREMTAPFCTSKHSFLSCIPASQICTLVCLAVSVHMSIALYAYLRVSCAWEVHPLVEGLILSGIAISAGHRHPE